MAVNAKLGAVLFALLPVSGANTVSPRGFELLKQAMEATPDPERGRILYLKHCTSCHAPRGWGDGPREVPSLAGQHEFYLLQQLVLFNTLDRHMPEMHQIVGRPDVDLPPALRALAVYLSHQPRNPHADHGDGQALPAGQRTYARACVMCHGKNGEGSENEPVPAIGGQHYYYVLAQLNGFAAGHRSEAHFPVVHFTTRLSPEERQGVADYVSRLTALRTD